MQTPKAPVRAIFFDIDGTLIPHRQPMPESTRRALALAREKGVLLFIASGRVPSMALYLRKEFDFDGYLTLNGQYCFDRDGKLLHAMPHSKESIRLLMELQKDGPFPCLVVESDAYFSTCDSELAAHHFLRHGMEPPALYDTARLAEHDVYQIITYDPWNTNPKLAPLTDIRIVYAADAADFCHDVIPAAGGKDVGIKAVAAHYGIPMESVMVFGDGLNDADMLRNTGFGVAMGNACPEAKAAAQYVTDAVDADGIYNALKKFHVI